ncbi:PP2C family protein-serine/threonine phosphatase [Amphibiibacter pelophylacis]|uniref:Protein phosphatase 2C domain-containing protein n=1 Tax=Amphibiibacter pelophylacis TaxID=1799477 RepID=A0ACC6NZA4_9BURK
MSQTLAAPPATPAPAAQASKKGHRLEIVTAINQGDREYQQDQVEMVPHHRVNGCLALLLADGMGGKSGGRKASEQVIMTSRQIFDRFVVGQDKATSILLQMVSESHLMIRLTAITSEEEPHSTFAGCIIEPDLTLSIAHAGDSRVYHFRDGKMLSCTKDHSYVQQLVDEGRVPLAEAAAHPQANLLVGCLGTQHEPPQTSSTAQLAVGDCVLVCSDGLWHYYKPEEFARVLTALAPRAAAELLMTKARTRANGRGDNLSMALVRVVPMP